MIARTRLSQPGRIRTTFSNPERVRTSFAKPKQIGTVVASNGNRVTLDANNPNHLSSVSGPSKSAVLSVSKSSQIVVTQVTTGLRGPRGLDASAMPSSPAFTWVSGKLTSIEYADGSSKSFTWSGERLVRIDFVRFGFENVRKDFNYNMDGTLASIVQSNF